MTAPLPPARDSRSPLLVTLRGGEPGLLVSPDSSRGSGDGSDMVLRRLTLGADVGPAPLGASKAGAPDVTSAMVGTALPEVTRPPEGMRAPSGAGPK